MSKKYLALCVIAPMMLASCGEDTTTQKATNVVVAPSESVVDTAIDAAKSVVATTAVAWYTMYNGEDLSTIWEKTVLFFHQKSCGTCVKTAQDIAAQESLPAGVKIIQADFDTDTALNAQYGITSKHSFVYIDEKWEMISSASGLTTVAEIEKFVQTAESPENAVSEAPVQAGPAGYSMYRGQDLSIIWEKTVLFFHQASCGTCVKTAKNIVAAASLPEGVKIIQADFDNDTELNKKYGVTSKHTFVYIDENGETIAKASGLVTLSDIAGFVKSAENQKNPVAAESSDNTSAWSAWSYAMYSWEDLSTIWKKSVLFFHQASCGTCVKTAKDIASQSSLPEWVNIIQVDIDNEKWLARTYDVTSKHTFVLIDEKGEKISTKAWLSTTQDIADFVKANS